jgi:hypothetical protein
VAQQAGKGAAKGCLSNAEPITGGTGVTIRCCPFIHQPFHSMKKLKRKSQHLCVAKPKLPSAKTIKNLPGLQKEAELETLAKQINKFHAEIEKDAMVVFDAGNRAIRTAIVCGSFLRRVKAALKHGQFEPWCDKHLKFKIRKAQYYMALAQRHGERDILRLNPQNLRQAYIYAGVLPEDSQTKKKRGKFDEVAFLRKAVHRLMLQLRSSEDYEPEKLLKETEPLVEWRQ